MDLWSPNSHEWTQTFIAVEHEKEGGGGGGGGGLNRKEEKVIKSHMNRVPHENISVLQIILVPY